MARYPDQFEKHAGVWKSQLAMPTTYSDGEGNEQYILDALSDVKDLSCLSDELQDQIRDWPSRYHLSPLRSNLLRGFKFRPDCKILEIGSGCGAITRYLGEQGHSVLALEGAAKRAEITRLRCRDLENVEVLNANLHDVQFQEKFDVVTLIGVLEYSAKYGSQKNLGDFLDTLRWAKAQLKPDGVLILAIENKFGLKYFTGCREDHTDHFFESIEGYYRPDSPRTFGRRELQRLMGAAGLEHSRFYLPFPDYKLPYVTLASREYYQDSGLDLNLSAWCDMPFESYGGRRLHLMNDQLALREMEKNGLLDEVANSFLIFASSSQLTADSPVDVRNGFIAQKVNLSRHSSFQTVTTLHLNGGQPTISKTVLVEKSGLPLGSNPVKAADPARTTVVSGNVGLSTHARETYLCGHEKLSLELIRAAKGRDSDHFWKLFKSYYQYLLSHADENRQLPSNCVDLLPFNVMINPQGKLSGFDFEWVYPGRVPVEWVVFRGSVVLFTRESRWLKNLEDCPSSSIGFAKMVFRHLGIRMSWRQLRRFIREERAFQKATGAWKENLAVGRPWRGLLTSYLVENLHHPRRMLRDLSGILLQAPYFFQKSRPLEPAEMSFQPNPTETTAVQVSHKTIVKRGYWADRFARLFLLEHWFLLENFVVRNLKVKYRRSIFGFLWTLLHPLLLGSIFFFLFKYIAKIQIPDYGAFVVVSIMPWTFFSQSVIEASESMYNNAHLLRKIYFPREAFPMSSVVTNFITLILSLPVMIAFAYTAGGGLGWPTLALIPILALTLMVTYGVGLLLSVLYIFYRDVRHIIGILIQVFFYGTPVIYEAKMVPDVWKPVMLLNPMASLIPAYRDVILYQRWPEWTSIGAAAVVTLAIMAVAYNYFAKYNRVIPEYV